MLALFLQLFRQVARADALNTALRGRNLKGRHHFGQRA